MADEGRVTKVVVEALGAVDPPGRLTKTVVETLGATDPAARVTQVPAESRQTEVDGIEHHLDRDEHQDKVAPCQKAENANPE